MHSSILVFVTTLLSVANAHGVVLGAQGEAGSPSSVGFKVDQAVARNCTDISPCQQDTTIIRDSEIKANVVNECGRTQLTGNIDIGENTENALAAGAVTQVKAGTLMTVTIHQVNADGAGPYACDIEETGNTGVFSQNMTVTNNVPGANGFSQAKTQAFNITVAIPDKLACTGGSTGNICTVRCRNNALAGPFGGCFPVQQTDTEVAKNVAKTIATAQSFDTVAKQIAQNKADFPAAVEANQNAGSGPGQQGAAAAAALLKETVVSKEAPTQTPDVVNNPGALNDTAPPAEASPTAVAGGGGNGNGGNKNGNGAGRGGNGNAGAGNQNQNQNGGARGGAGAGNGRGGNNNNNKRTSSGLRWAKRIIYGEY